MSLGKVQFNRSGSALGGALPTKDHISALLFYSNGTLPSGFDTNNRIKKVFALKDAEALGIIDDHSDETKATGMAVTITLTGATDDINVIHVNGAPIGTYKTVSADSISEIVAGLVASINSNNNLYNTGYTAVDADPEITITIPDEIGAATSTVSFESVTAAGATGTTTATVVQATSGAGSFFAVMHYHISEYFRKQPQGELYIGIYGEPTTYDAAEVQTMQNFAQGEIRKFGIFINHTAFATSQVTATQTITDAVRAEKKPLGVLFHADSSGITLSAASDLNTLDSEDIGTVLSEDGNYHQPAYVGATVSTGVQSYILGEKRKWLNKTYVCKKAITNSLTEITGSPVDTSVWSQVSLNLPSILGYSISDLGAKLGAWSFSSVNESIAGVSRFPMTSGEILAEAGFATGDLNKNLSESALDSLDNKNYIFLRTFVGKSGTFNSGEWTATLRNDDYVRLSRGQTMDKAERLVYIDMVNLLSSVIYVDADGKLSDDTVAKFKNTADASVDSMRRAKEVSEFRFTINPDQNVLATEQVVLSMELLPSGIARDIVVNAGFVKQL